MPTPGGLQTTTFINESGLYSLILSSKLPKAREVLEVLRGRNVLVFLDRDAMEEWSGKLAGMRDLANFRVSSRGQTKAEKSDIADVLMAR